MQWTRGQRPECGSSGGREPLIARVRRKKERFDAVMGSVRVVQHLLRDDLR